MITRYSGRLDSPVGMELLTDPTRLLWSSWTSMDDNLNARTPADTINLHMDAYSAASLARSVKLSTSLSQGHNCLWLDLDFIAPAH